MKSEGDLLVEAGAKAGIINKKNALDAVGEGDQFVTSFNIPIQRSARLEIA